MRLPPFSLFDAGLPGTVGERVGRQIDSEQLLHARTDSISNLYAIC